ncbi:MAG: hypothetical protein M3Q08_03580 [Pseudomonadota bacterium]|nr:hypothetical protein [Pseudomonadota bacterium]
MGGPTSVFKALPPAAGEAEPPPVGFFGSIGPGFRRARAAEDWGLNQANYEGRVLQAVRAEAMKRGARFGRTGPAPASPYGYGKTLDQVADEEAEQLLGWAAAERKRDPNFLPEFTGIDTRQALREWALQQRRADMAKADEELRNGSTAGALVGALGAGFLDPTSYIPIAGNGSRALSIGRQILSAMGREAAANVGMTIAQEPLVQQDAKALGVERGASDVMTEIGLSAVVGGAIGGGAKGLELGAEALAARRAVPDADMTPDDRAAVNVVERADEIAATSPFEAGGAGDKAHAAQLDRAFQTALGARPKNVPRETVTRGQLLAGTADLSRLRLPARSQVKARIRIPESDGNDRAKNPLSSASGRYQFIRPTWINLFRNRYGKSLSGDEIWAKRFDVHLQEVLMDDLLADNARRLREVGLPETAGNLYMLHFAGPKGKDILRADPDLPTSRFFSPDEIARNKRVLENKTVGQLVAWANRAVGDEAPPVRVASEEGDAAALPELPDVDRGIVAVAEFEARPDWLEDADLPMLRADLFGTPEEHARAQVALWRERDAAEGFAVVVDDPPPPGPTIEVPDKAPRKRSGPVHVMQAIADGGGIRDDEGHDLVKGRNIPKFMLGAGVIVKKDGRSIDAMGEHLWEQGFFGPPETMPRPTERQVLDLIERAKREKVYKPEEAADVQARAQLRVTDAEEEDARFELAETARELGFEMDQTTLDDALMRRARGEPVEDAVLQARDAAAFRDLDPPASLARFDDPDGDGVAMQIDSLAHDLMMAMEAGDAGSYRFSEEGEPMTLAEMFETLDDDVQAAEVLRACMAPPVREAAE